MSDDPYSVLGVAKDASATDIKKAYRRIAKDCHPDLKPGDAHRSYRPGRAFNRIGSRALVAQGKRA